MTSARTVNQKLNRRDCIKGMTAAAGMAAAPEVSQASRTRPNLLLILAYHLVAGAWSFVSSRRSMAKSNPAGSVAEVASR